jgi:3'-5' exoribonuclease
VNVDDFLARTDKDIDKIFAETERIVGVVKNQQLKALVDEFLADEKLMKRFCSCPGGMSMHHDYIGGLLEHTWNMLRVASAILPLYPDVQADLVLAGYLSTIWARPRSLHTIRPFHTRIRGSLLGIYRSRF